MPTQSVRDITEGPGQVSFVLTFSPEEVRVSQRGEYTALSVSRGAPQGGEGRPALPWRKLYAFIPDGSSVQGTRFEIKKTVPLAANVLVEPIQPNIPTAVAMGGRMVGPDLAVYARARAWPETVGRFVAVRRLGGKQLVEVEVCPFQYWPAERRLDLVEALTVTIDISRAEQIRMKPASTAAIRSEQRSLERVKKLVVNPGQVASQVQLDITPLDTFVYPDVPYVIITSTELAGAFQRLAEWRTVLGRSARVVTVADIEANAVADTNRAIFWKTSGYPDGGTRDRAEAVRNFIKWARTHWQTEFVLLGGDTGIIPARMGWITWVGTMSYGDIAVPDTSASLVQSATASTSAANSDPKHATDTDAATGWSCAANDPTPWISAQLSGRVPVNHVQLVWGTAATAYKVQISNDSVSWVDVYVTTAGAGGTVEIGFTCRSATFVRLQIQSGTNFQLRTLKVFGPYRNNTAYAISPTRTRVYLRSWLQPNPSNSPEGDQLVIIDGANKGKVVPYNLAANDTTLGWHFVTDLMQTPGIPTASYAQFLEICGPAAFHGAQLCAKTHENSIPTDLYYADLDSPSATLHDWDADNNRIYGERYGNQIDGVNGMADVHVGRFSVTTPQQVEVVIDKVIRYETYRDTSIFGALLPWDFATSALLAAQNWYDPGPGQLDGSAACNEDIRHMLMASGTPWTFTRLYEDKADVAAADVAPDLQEASKDAVKAAIAAGNNVVSLVSHGSPSYVCYLVPSDVDNEMCTPAIWYGNACSTNQFDGDTLGETAVLNSLGGAVAYVGNSRYGWTGDGPMEKAFWEEMLDSGLLGPMLESAHQIGGDWQKYSLNLIGDPAMRVWSAAPRQITVTHAAEIYSGGQIFPVTVKRDGVPVPSATVCASVAGSFCASGATDAGGVAKLQINPASEGTMRVAVSGKNLLPYIGSVTVKQKVVVCKPLVACMAPLGCRIALACGTRLSCGIRVLCGANVVQTCQYALMCKRLVACSMAIGAGCPVIRPEDQHMFDEVFERFGIADMVEFARQADQPEIKQRLAALPVEDRKPIEMMLERIRKEELHA